MKSVINLNNVRDNQTDMMLLSRRIPTPAWS